MQITYNPEQIMKNQQEIALLEAFRNSSVEHQISLLSLAKKCAERMRKSRYSTLPLDDFGAEEQAISINVLPSSVASR
jgi:hypothetical protein